MLKNGEMYRFMDSKWDMNSDIVKDLKFAVSKMQKRTNRYPKRIECTKEVYTILSGELNSMKKRNGIFTFPWSILWDEPINMLFLQTDFSKWSDEDVENGYKVVY